MTPADKLRELLASRPAQPTLEELVRWWRSSVELLPRMLNELADVEIAVDAYKTAFEPAFDEIAKLCGCPQWDYPGQLIRDVQNVVQERDELRAARDVLKQEVRELGQQRDQLMTYIDDAKRAAGSERVGGEPLAEFVARHIEESGEVATERDRLRAELERARATLAQRERMEAGHA